MTNVENLFFDKNFIQSICIVHYALVVDSISMHIMESLFKKMPAKPI